MFCGVFLYGEVGKGVNLGDAWNENVKTFGTPPRQCELLMPQQKERGC